MKKSMNDKLKMYSAFAGTAVASTVGAQVVFTDINPDTVLHDNMFYNLDLNNDATGDFAIASDTVLSSVGQVNISAMQIIGGNNDAILGSLYATTYPFPFALNNGDTVKPTNPNWNAYAQNSGLNYLGVFVPPTTTYANWVGATDKYVGLRIDVAGQMHYGWARMTITADGDSIIIKEYAYEQTPNQYIICGQVVSVPTEHHTIGVNIHSYENAVFVHTTTPEKGGVISVYDITGQLVREEEITSGDVRINMENQSTGMYVVHVLQGDVESTQKIYLK